MTTTERAILAMTDPVAQHYAFCRYVLGEPRMDAMAMAAAQRERLTLEQMRHVRANWEREG